MRLLSSSNTGLYKRVFPGFWFGLLGIFFFAGLMGAFKDGGGLAILLVPLGMAPFGFAIFKIFVWNLVDEVWDDTDTLVVRNGGIEARIDLHNIAHIDHSNFVNPPSVTLTLREPCLFGKVVKFTPPRKFLGLGQHPVVAEFIQRIDNNR